MLVIPPEAANQIIALPHGTAEVMPLAVRSPRLGSGWRGSKRHGATPHEGTRNRVRRPVLTSTVGDQIDHRRDPRE